VSLDSWGLTCPCEGEADLLRRLAEQEASRSSSHTWPITRLLTPCRTRSCSWMLEQRKTVLPSRAYGISRTMQYAFVPFAFHTPLTSML
jgi:hypothetical protein